MNKIPAIPSALGLAIKTYSKEHLFGIGDGVPPAYNVEQAL